MTYQKEEEKIETLRNKLGGSLKSFYKYLELKLKEYEDSKVYDSFSDFLFASPDA